MIDGSNIALTKFTIDFPFHYSNNNNSNAVNNNEEEVQRLMAKVNPELPEKLKKVKDHNYKLWQDWKQQQSQKIQNPVP